ncbi:MAG: WD40 repeat domain-containing protein [Peptostreptococcaceae bacterium]|jgi:WD40 repeat protein|nr:WD40 repeat domain-containing protein [Peptostreptococcaceae bacterium]
MKKKTIGISLIVLSLLLIPIGIKCSTALKNEKVEIKVLENQKNEIINKDYEQGKILNPRIISEVDNLQSYFWIGENEIFGINKEDGKQTLALYNLNENKIEKFNETEQNQYISIYGFNDLKDKIVYSSPNLNEDGGMIISFLDLKEKKNIILDSGISMEMSANAWVDNYIYYAKGLDIIKVDFKGNKEVIKLSNKVQSMIKDKNQKESIVTIFKEKDDLYFSTAYSQGFKYNEKNKELKLLSEKDKIQLEEKIIKTQEPSGLSLSNNNKSVELWINDNQGKKKKLIAKSNHRIIPMMSPNKNYVFYIDYLHKEWGHEDTKSKAYLYDIVSEKSISVINEQEIYLLDWSPDSKYVFVTVNEENTGKLKTKIIEIKK